MLCTLCSLELRTLFVVCVVGFGFLVWEAGLRSWGLSPKAPEVGSLILERKPH